MVVGLRGCCREVEPSKCVPGEPMTRRALCVCCRRRLHLSNTCYRRPRQERRRGATGVSGCLSLLRCAAPRLAIRRRRERLVRGPGLGRSGVQSHARMHTSYSNAGIENGWRLSALRFGSFASRHRWHPIGVLGEGGRRSYTSLVDQVGTLSRTQTRECRVL